MQVAFYASGNPVHDNVIGSMLAGLPDARSATVSHNFEYVEADIAVVFGVHKNQVPISWPRGKIIARQRACGGDVIVLETGYIKRGDGPDDYYAAGFNGLNGRAYFNNENMPTDRADELGVVLQPIRYGGKKILLCGQVPQDASVDHIDIMRWLHAARDEIKKRTDREILFKPHPKAPIGPIAGCGYTTRPLIEAIQDCSSVVTFNSNSAVEAVIEGVPVFAFDRGSMAWDVANTSWDDIIYPLHGDRRQWLNDLAYAQWTPTEMREGKAWQHLLQNRT